MLPLKLARVVNVEAADEAPATAAENTRTMHVLLHSPTNPTLHRSPLCLGTNGNSPKDRSFSIGFLCAKFISRCGMGSPARVLCGPVRTTEDILLRTLLTMLVRLQLFVTRNYEGEPSRRTLAHCTSGKTTILEEIIKQPSRSAFLCIAWRQFLLRAHGNCQNSGAESPLLGASDYGLFSPPAATKKLVQ